MTFLIWFLALFVWPIAAPMPAAAFRIGIALAWSAIAIFVLWRRRLKGLWVLLTIPLAIFAFNMANPMNSIGYILAYSICGDATAC